MAEPTAPPRHAGALPDAAARRRFRTVVVALVLGAVAVATALLAWANPMPVGSAGFWRIAELRMTNLTVIAVVAFCQGVATVAFQTVTGNRIVTPSIIGFESLYRVVQTGAVFFLGLGGAAAIQGVGLYLGQVALMVLFSAVLFGRLLSGRFANLQIMLLIGIVLGGGLGSLATFMQRLLTPTEFDVLVARLIGSVANADATYLAIAVPLAAAAGATLWVRSRRLDVLGLGKETATNLGLDHRRATIEVLLLVAVLMAVSTSLVGPMTFFGFLTAMITYQLADTFDHRYLFPVAWLVGFVVLGGGYFVLRHLFYAQGSVGVIIEIVGGTFFLVHLLRKGRL